MEKQEIDTITHDLDIKQSPLFKKTSPSKGKQGLNYLADISLMIPGLVESLQTDTKYVVDISTDIGKKLTDGSLEFLQKANGDALAIVRDPKTKKIIKQLPIKAELATPMLGPAMLAAGLFVKLQKIEKGIEELNQGISDILQNFENDRYARAFAAKEKLEQALLFSDKKLKQEFLLAILSDVTNTKHMLYKQLTDKVDKLINTKTRFKDKSTIDLANQSLQNLYLFNECFKIQIQCYTELEEHYALSHALDMYNKEMDTVLTKDVQLAVDGYFKEATNPFSHAVTDVLESVSQTNDFLSMNETLVLEQLH